jgi:DNA-binding transcriptional MerR regulator
VTDLHKYKRDKKIPKMTKTSNDGIAFSKMSLSSFYDCVEGNYHISDRMVRRYIGRGLIPPPERYGKKAFYDEVRSNVFHHLNVIDTLKKRYNLSLDDIEVIVNNYRDQIVELDFILTDIEIEYNKPRRTSPYYVWIRKRFLEIIKSKTENLEKLNIKTIEKEIKRKQS